MPVFHAHSGRVVALVALAALLAGCTGDAPGASRTPGDRCYGNPGTAYGHGALLAEAFRAPPRDIAARLAKNVGDNLTAQQPVATASVDDSSWTQWSTDRGNVTIHLNATGAYTKGIYRAARVWPSVNASEAEPVLRGVLADFGAPTGSDLYFYVGDNSTAWVRLVFAQFAQRHGEWVVDATAGTLTTQSSVQGNRADDATLELHRFHDLSQAVFNITFDDAAHRASKVLECVFDDERPKEDPFESLRSSPVRVLAVVGDSLVYRIAFTYGDECHDQRERKVDVDAHTGAIHAVTAPRIACVDRDRQDHDDDH